MPTNYKISNMVAIIYQKVTNPVVSKRQVYKVTTIHTIPPNTL